MLGDLHIGTNQTSKSKKRIGIFKEKMKIIIIIIIIIIVNKKPTDSFFLFMLTTSHMLCKLNTSN